MEMKVYFVSESHHDLTAVLLLSLVKAKLDWWNMLLVTFSCLYGLFLHSNRQSVLTGGFQC